MKSFIRFLAAAALVVCDGGAANAQTPITLAVSANAFGTVAPSDPNVFLGTPGGSISATLWAFSGITTDNTGITILPSPVTLITFAPTANTIPLSNVVGTTFTLSWTSGGNTFSDTLTENSFSGSADASHLAMTATGNVSCISGATCSSFSSSPSTMSFSATQTVLDTGTTAFSASFTYAAAPGPIPGAGLLSYLALGIIGLGSMGLKRLRGRTAVAA
jgi:hypothetical protein